VFDTETGVEARGLQREEEEEEEEDEEEEEAGRGEKDRQVGTQRKKRNWDGKDGEMWSEKKKNARAPS